MRLFRTSEPASTAEDDAAAVRLVTIANRTTAAATPDFSIETTSETPDSQDTATLQ